MALQFDPKIQLIDIIEINIMETTENHSKLTILTPKMSKMG